MSDRITYPTKSNNPSDPDINRKYFATEADQVKEVVNSHATELEQHNTRLQALELSTSPNPFYGRYSSLALLQATYPVGEENAWAVIDAGTGITPVIVFWDDIDQTWEISGAVIDKVYVATSADLPPTGVADTFYISLDRANLYLWYNNKFNMVGALQFASIASVNTKLDSGGYAGTAQDLFDAIEAIGDTPGISTITGDGVNNTDPDNPVMELGAYLETDNMNPPTQSDASLVDADEFTFFDAALGWFQITYANIKANLKAYFDGLYVTITNFLQEKLSGTTIFATDVSGTYNVDWNTGSVWDINCNGNTTLADTNLPISGTNKVINIYMDFDNGTEVVTLPGYWIKDPDSDDLDATQRVRLTVEAINNTSDVTYYVKNLG